MLGRRDGTPITVLDKLTYAGNEANLAPVRADPELAARLRSSGRHRRRGGRRPAGRRGRRGRQLRRRIARRPVDPRSRRRSCATGVIGVHVLLEACRAAARPAALPPGLDRRGLRLGRRRATPREDAPLAPRSPYAAAKAAGELLVRSYVVTHGLDAVVTRGSNTYGPYHHPEKLDPAVHHQRHRRPAAAALRRRPPAARLAVRVATTPAAIDFVLRHGVAGETYNVAGRGGDDEPRGRGAPARAARQAVVARPQVEDRPGPRSSLRDGRRQARRARLAPGTSFEDGPRRDGRLVSWPTRPGGGRPARATGTPSTSASTATGWPRRRRPPTRPIRPTDAGRRDRRRGRLGSALVDGARRRAVHRPGRADRLGPDRVRPRCARRRSGRGSIATGRRSSSTPPPGPTSTAAPSTRRWRCAATATATGVLAGPAPSAGIDLLVVSTNEVFDGSPRPTARPTGRPTRPHRAIRTARPSWPASGAASAAFAATGREPRHRPDGVAVRAAGRDFPSRILDAADRARGGRRAAARRRRRVGDADLHAPTSPRRSSSCSRRTRVAGIHHLVNGLFATRADWARDVVGRAGLDGRDRRRPASTWARPSAPPRWGVLAPTPLPSGEPLRAVARRDGRLRARRCCAPARMRRERDRAPPSALPGVRYGAVARHADDAAPSASSGAATSASSIRRRRRRSRASTFVQANLSTSAAGRPARPPPPPSPGRPLDRAAGRAFVALVDVRPLLATARGTAGRRDARARRRRLGPHPGRRRPRLPGARAARAHLPRDQRVRRHRRAGLRLGRSGRRACPGRRSPATPDGRPILSERDASNPSLADSWCACADGADLDPDRTAPPRLPTPATQGASGSGTIPRLRRHAAPSLTEATVPSSSLGVRIAQDRRRPRPRPHRHASARRARRRGGGPATPRS